MSVGSLEDLALQDAALTTVRFLTKQIRVFDNRLSEAVDVARRRGCTWEEIATELGVKRTSAESRFRSRVTPIDLRRADHPHRAAIREKHGWEKSERNGA